MSRECFWDVEKASFSRSFRGWVIFHEGDVDGKSITVWGAFLEPEQDYKSLHVAVIICNIMVNRHIHTDSFRLVIYYWLS